MLHYENKAKKNGYSFIVGVDEAGRGPLAGPVVAAAVALKDVHFETKINDSKKMTPNQRDKAFKEIYQRAYVGVGIMSESVIDRHNILQATFLAMSRAVHQLAFRLPQKEADLSFLINDVFLLIDGNSFKSDLPFDFETIIEGDAKSLSVACASIIAKVIRDRILVVYDQVYPEYGFRWHKGYATLQHRKALKKFGPSDIHRRSFQWGL